jgi:hypothetical protein
MSSVHPTIVQKVCFSRPTIGPRDYVSVGASGWAEVFPKKTADAALQAFIGQQVTLDELLKNFDDLISLQDKHRCAWTDVTGYLGRVFEKKPDQVPASVAISFWAHMVQLEKARVAG